MKRYLSFLALTLAVLLALNFTACKSDVTDDETDITDKKDIGNEVADPSGNGSFLYDITDVNTLRIIGYKGEITLHDIVIPAEIGGIEVTEIGQKAFYFNNTIKSVTIPATVTLVDEFAFTGCSYLESVTIAEGVESIGSSAFLDCVALKEITLPQSLKELGDFAFKGCSSLTKANIPSGITRIGEALFWECSSLKSVSGLEGVIEIDSFAFNDCKKLESLTIPAVTEKIHEYAFNGCNELTLKVTKGSYAEDFASLYGYKYTN